MTKLIDILAREWSVWPDYISGVHRNCGGWVYAGPPDQRFKPNFPVCEDLPRNSGVVTRAEWQAARDALVAAECAHSYRNAQGCPECGVAFAQPEFPLLGDVIRIDATGQTIWDVAKQFIGVDVTVVAKFRTGDTDMIAVEREDIGQCICFRASMARAAAEQIAADEREKAANELCQFLAENCRGRGADLWAAAQKLYDIGYRKQVAK